MARDKTVARILARSRNVAGLKRAVSNRRDSFSVDYPDLMSGTPGGGGGGDGEWLLSGGQWNDAGVWDDAAVWEDAA